MRYRKLILFLFPFLICALIAFRTSQLSMPFQLLDCSQMPLYNYILNSLLLAFQTSASGESGTLLIHLSWIVTYAIAFELAMIMIKLVTFLPRVIDKMFNKFLGDNDE